MLVVWTGERLARLSLVIAVLLSGLLVTLRPARAATFTVTTTNDSGAGSLRQAIIDANTNGPSLDTISFAIPLNDPGCDPGTGVCTIFPRSALPIILTPMVIDGFTQQGAQPATPNTNPMDQPINAALKIELSGIHAGGATGLRLSGGGTTVRGLVINRFGGGGMLITMGGGNVIAGNFIGTDVTGMVDHGNNGDGIEIFASPNNRIGGTAAPDRNLISANAGYGITMYAASTNNVVQGNFVGTDAQGTAPLGNGLSGVYLSSLAQGNVVGGTSLAIMGTSLAPAGLALAASNLISGNARSGVDLAFAANGNRIEGNRIGTDRTGAAPLGNLYWGVYIYAASNNTIGGASTTPGAPAPAGNLISGNLAGGVVIHSFTTSLIAPDPADRSRVGPFGAPGASGNLVQGNFIGTDVTGTRPLGNRDDGVRIESDATGNAVGGTALQRNLISANGDDGVHIEFPDATGNLIQGNYIGTDVTGAQPLGNAAHGVRAINSGPNTIGNPPDGSTGRGNRIAYNQGDGVAIILLPAPSNRKPILGNEIFANGDLGIDLDDDGPTPNDVGDGDAGANSRQNHPVLTSASVTGGGTVVQGSLGSMPNRIYRVEFFSSPSCDPSGFGEGQRFLGGRDIATDSNGSAPINEALGPIVPAGEVVTATATDQDGNTSEFSNCVVVGGAAPTTTPTRTATPGASPTPTRTPTRTATPTVHTPTATPVGALVVNSTDDEPAPLTDGLCTPAHCNLREALAAANSQPGADTLLFRIPGTDPGCDATRGVCSIKPRSPLPASTGPLAIDGYSQLGAQAAGVGPLRLPLPRLGARGLTIPPIELNGVDAGPLATGLQLNGGNSRVRGLTINHFKGDGLRLAGNGNLVTGMFIGTDVTGTLDQGNEVDGILIEGANNTIGGTNPSDRNVISANYYNGITIRGATSTDNLVLGNRIGTDVGGVAALGNGANGVAISSASSNTVGGNRCRAGQPHLGQWLCGGPGACRGVPGRGESDRGEPDRD